MMLICTSTASVLQYKEVMENNFTYPDLFSQIAEKK